MAKLSRTAPLLVAAWCAAPVTAQGDTLLVRADRIMIAPGTVIENQAILIRDGVIAFVGDEIPEQARRGVRVESFAGTIAPGIVNPHSHLGLGEDLAERITANTPELRAADAFDPFDEHLLHNARFGVTTVGLAPLSSNTFAGQAAAIRGGPRGSLVADACYLKVALVPESLDQERFPTSRMGAARLIESSFAAARVSLAAGDAREVALRAVLDGATALAIHARSHGAITAALDLCAALEVTPLLLGADEAGRSLSRIAALGGSVVLGPLQFDGPTERLELPRRLEAAGIPFSFMATETPAAIAALTEDGGDGDEGRGRRRAAPPGPVPAPPADDPASLRTSAALAIRHGASRRAALAAITEVPARQCGIAERCGTLRQGSYADFVVWSGDPMDLTSRLIAVFVGGVRLDLDEQR